MLEIWHTNGLSVESDAISAWYRDTKVLKKFDDLLITAFNSLFEQNEHQFVYF